MSLVSYIALSTLARSNWRSGASNPCSLPNIYGGFPWGSTHAKFPNRRFPFAFVWGPVRGASHFCLPLHMTSQRSSPKTPALWSPGCLMMEGKKSWNYRGVWGPVCRSIKDHLLRVWYGKTVGPSLGHSVYLLSISVAFCLSGRPQQAKTTQISTLLSNNLPTSFNYSFDMSELHEFWRMTHFPPKGHEDRWADSIVQLSVICKQRQHRARNPGKTVYFRCNNVSN